MTHSARIQPPPLKRNQISKHTISKIQPVGEDSTRSEGVESSRSGATPHRQGTQRLRIDPQLAANTLDSTLAPRRISTSLQRHTRRTLTQLHRILTLTRHPKPPIRPKTLSTIPGTHQLGASPRSPARPRRRPRAPQPGPPVPPAPSTPVEPGVLMIGSEWSISKPGQAPPPPTGTAARPRRPRGGLQSVGVLCVARPGLPHRRVLVSLTPELTTNFACNSPATISNHEFVALEFQRFLGLLKVCSIELHAT